MRSRSVLLTASLLLTIGMFVAGTAGAAKVKLSTAKAKPVKILGTAEYQYSSDSIIWFECRKRTKPLMVGWSGPNAPLSIIYTHAYNTSGQVALAVRKPARTGKFKSFARCAGGPIAAKAKQAPKRVQCGKKQVAIGAPIDGGPYYQESVFSKPIGTRGWANNESASSSAKVICASKKAFKRANLAKRSTTFKPNARTVTVTAKCKGGRVPISWGFEAEAMPGNTWTSPSSTSTARVPLISKSGPKGKTGWSLTFFTPDGKGATERAEVVVHVTCARLA